MLTIACQANEEPVEVSTVVDIATPGVPEGSVVGRLTDRADGVLPFPFSELSRQWKYLGEFPMGTALPKGRSLQAPHVTTLRPRAVLTSLNTNKSLRIVNPKGAEVELALPSGMLSRKGLESTPLEGRLFIGYADLVNEKGEDIPDEMEIISWNDETLEFDFLIAHQYGASDFSIGAPVESICLNCHKGGAAIFSQGPWSEVRMANPHVTTPAKVRIVHTSGWGGGTKEVLQTDPAIGTVTGRIVQLFGLLTRSPPEVAPPDGAALAFDQAAHVANRLAQSASVCKKLCSTHFYKDEREECRRDLIRIAMHNPRPSDYIHQAVGSQRLPGAEDTFFRAHRTPPRLASVERRLAAKLGGDVGDDTKLFPYHSHVLPDPKRETDELRLKPSESRGLHDGVPAGHAAPYLIDVGFECLGLYPEDAGRMVAISPRAESFLKSPQGAALVGGWPVNRRRIIAAIDAFEAQAGPERVENQGTQLAQVFDRYCSRCHDPKEDSALVTRPRIHFSDLGRLGSELRDKSAWPRARTKDLLERICDDVMPPEPTDGDVAFPTAAMKSAMVSFIQAQTGVRAPLGCGATKLAQKPQRARGAARVSFRPGQRYSYVVPDPALEIVSESVEKLEDETSVVVGVDQHGQHHYSPDVFPGAYLGDVKAVRLLNGRLMAVLRDGSLVFLDGRLAGAAGPKSTLNADTFSIPERVDVPDASIHLVPETHGVLPYSLDGALALYARVDCRCEKAEGSVRLVRHVQFSGGPSRRDRNTKLTFPDTVECLRALREDPPRECRQPGAP